MYSVVETKEKYKLVVIAVPTNWIIGGDILFWPAQVKNKLELDELLKDPNSVPDLVEWKSQKCSVRASKIENYSLAVTIEKAFLNCRDTDDEEIYSCRTKRTRRKIKSSENICRLETKLDEVLKKSNEPFQCFQEQEDMSWCDFKFPLNTVDEVQRFERQLLSTRFYKNMAEYLLKKTCAKDTRDVKKVTKNILFELFTLEVLKSFSWTGRGNKKPAFSSLNRVLNIILDIERQADSTYNEEKSSNFLQNKWFKCLNQTIRRTELKNKSRIDDDLLGNENTVQEVVQDQENV